MDSGFEALPARVSRANGRKRRVVTLSSSASAPSTTEAAPVARASHAYNVITDASAVLAEESSAPVLYDSAVSESADVDTHSQPGGVEGSGGLGKWEYLDHTADVQVHTWGDSLAEAFAQQALGMWAYMTDLRGITVDPSVTRIIEVDGIDLCSLLFGWLDGCLAAYGMDYFIGCSIAVTHWGQDTDQALGSLGRWRIRAIVRGALFVFGQHAQGTEVKAITYSNMQIFCADGTVVSANDAIDAAAAAALEQVGGSAHSAEGTVDTDAVAAEGGAERAGERKGIVDVYVIVDI